MDILSQNSVWSQLDSDGGTIFVTSKLKPTSLTIQDNYTVHISHDDSGKFSVGISHCDLPTYMVRYAVESVHLETEWPKSYLKLPLSARLPLSTSCGATKWTDVMIPPEIRIPCNITITYKKLPD